MNFKINRTELLKALTVIENALPVKTVIDSLKGIKIEANNDTITFTASKQDLAITYIVKENFEILSEGITIIPGNQFITIVKRTEEDIFEITNKEGSTFLKTKRSKINLIEYETNSYPKILFDVEKGKTVTLKNEILKKSYLQNKHATSINNSKTILTGLNFNIENSKLSVGSTDAKRLAISKFKIDESENINFTISKNILSVIIKTLDLLNIDEVNLISNNNQIIIHSENFKLKARLIEGEYPEIQKLIPNVINYSYDIDSESLKKIIEKILLLSERESGNIIASIDNGSLMIKSQFKELGGIEEVCEINNLNGSPFTIAFAPKFLLEAINALDAKEITLKFVDEISAFEIIKVEENSENKCIQVISPIRMT